MRPIIPVILSIVALSTTGQAQERWNLEKCIQYALENNIQVKQQNLSIRTSQNALTAQKMGVAPSVNASASHNYTFGRAIDYGTNSVSTDLQSTSLSVSASATLFNGLKQHNGIKQAKIDLMASVADADKLKDNISLNITSAYLQILYNTELVGTNKRALELSELQCERTKNLVKAGSLAEGSLLEIEAQRASDELNLVNSENQLELSYLTLVQMLDIRSTDSFRIAKPNIEGLALALPTSTASSIYQQAEQSLPQIRGAALRVESAQRNVAIAKGSRYPTLSIGANYGSGARKYLDPSPAYPNQPYSDQIRDNASTSVGFSLSIPIFNGLQVEKSISNAKIGLENAQLSLASEKNQLFKDIQQAYTDAVAAQKKLKATEKNNTALEESLRYTESKFNVGLVNALDYTTARNKLSESENSLLQAKYELIFKIKILQFYQGQPLSL